jgi:hypothetical protein
LPKRLELQDYIKSDDSPSVNLVRATMVLKALTFNKKSLDENFDSSIKDLLKESQKALQSVLDKIQPDDASIKLTTYANLIEAMTFQSHPSNKNEKLHYFIL